MKLFKQVLDDKVILVGKSIANDIQSLQFTSLFAKKIYIKITSQYHLCMYNAINIEDRHKKHSWTSFTAVTIVAGDLGSKFGGCKACTGKRIDHTITISQRRYDSNSE